MDCISLAKHPTATTQSGRSISAQQPFTSTSCVQTVTVNFSASTVQPQPTLRTHLASSKLTPSFSQSVQDIPYLPSCRDKMLPAWQIRHPIPCSRISFLSRILFCFAATEALVVSSSQLRSYPTNSAREALLTPSFKQAAYMDHSNQGSSCKIPNSVVPRRALTRHRGEGTSLKHGLGCGSGLTVKPPHPYRVYSTLCP